MYSNPNPLVRMRFPIIGQAELPIDHGEALYASISRLLPELHGQENLGISAIEGGYADRDMLKFSRGGNFYIQVPSELIPIPLRLAGQALNLRTQNIRIGVPQLTLINSTSNLYARMVTVKGKEDEDSLKAYIHSAINNSGCLNGQDSYELRILRRRILNIHKNRIVAFGVSISKLSEQLSVWLQEQGTGGRRRYGCGFYVPFDEVRLW